MEAPVLDVSDWLRSDDEWLGDQEKRWLVAPSDARSAAGERWLFKPSRHTPLPGRKGAPARLHRWFDAESEWIAYQLANSIGVPSAEIRLARRGTTRGSLSRDVTSPDEDLQSGDVFLGGLLGEDYLPNAEKARDRRGHRLESIGRVLDGLPGPPTTAEMPANQVFAGYLVLDAWIGNTDRHAENWALTVRGASLRLAASFDHGSALAAGVEDTVLARKEPRAFADGAMARKFEGGHGVPLVALAHDAMMRWGGPWIDALSRIEAADEREIVDAVPGMSQLRRTFVHELLEENRRRLLAS